MKMYFYYWSPDRLKAFALYSYKLCGIEQWKCIYDKWRNAFLFLYLDKTLL